MRWTALVALALFALAPAAAQVIPQKPRTDPAVDAYARQDFETAYELSKERCTETDTSGCALYGDILRRGLVEFQNYPAAVDAYDKGCDGGDARACAALGNLYVRGVFGVDQDFEAGETAYRRACDLGSTNGCAGLGNLLMTALRGPLTRDEGVALLRKTCRDGYEYSCDQLRKAGIAR
ncbi:MAG: tetratricopeptide repeat protein [Pseudomonadota bacterium]